MSRFFSSGRSLLGSFRRSGNAAPVSSDPVVAKGAARREIVATATLVAFVLSQAVFPGALTLRNAQAQSAPKRAGTVSGPSAPGAPQWFVESRRRDARRREEMARGMKTLLAQAPKPPVAGRTSAGRSAAGRSVPGGAVEVSGLGSNPRRADRPRRESVPGQIVPSAELYVPNPYTTVVPLDLAEGQVPTQKEVSGQGGACGALAPAAPAEPAEFEAEIDRQLRAAGFPQGLRTPLPSAEMAGLAPGVRVMALRLEAAQKRVKAAKEANREFALAMLDWNAGRFKKSVRDMEAYIRKHPRSPWLPEALIHIADYAKFTSQPNRAQDLYQKVMQITSATPGEMSYEAHQKAYERWADLYIVEGRWAEARPMLEELLHNDKHWRRRTWAAYWLRQLKVKSSDREEMLAALNCGPLALAMVFDELGQNGAARRVAALRPAGERGLSLAQLRDIAAREGLKVEGFRARPAQLAALPLPLILHYTPLPTPNLKGSPRGAKAKATTPSKPDAPGHFMIVRSLDARRGTASLINPQDGMRSTLSFAQLGREWSGAGLRLASAPKTQVAQHTNWREARAVRWLAQAPALKATPKTGKAAPTIVAKKAAPAEEKTAPRVALLSEGEMRTLRGTCYVVGPQNGLGRNPANRGCNGGCPPNRGTPGVEVNQLTQNVFINDTPLWYDPAYGPSIDVTLSYNSHDASNYVSPVGNKWSLNLGAHLVEAPSDKDGWGRITLFSADGKQMVFEPENDPIAVVDYKVQYRSQRGVYDTLTRTSSTGFVLTSPEGDKSFFGVQEGISSSVPMLLAERDRFGHTLTFHYIQPSAHQVLIGSVTAADGKTVRFSYNANGRLVAAHDPFDRSASFSYDAYGNLVECIDMGGYAFQYTYDNKVNVRQMNTPQGPWNFAYVYQAVHNTHEDSVTISDPLGQKEKFAWDGHKAVVTDHRGKTTTLAATKLIDTSAKDAQAGKNLSEVAIQSQAAPTGESVSYDYGAAGDGTAASKTLDPVAVTDARGHITSFDYNDQGNVVSTSDPKGNVTQVAYSDDGLNVIGMVNANGVTVFKAGYNAQHQLTVMSSEDGVSNYTYTAWGAPATVTDPLGTTTYNYNTARRLSSVVRDGATLGSFTYDNVGRLTTQTDETGLTLSYTYDSLNRVTKVSYPDATTEETDYACCGLPGMTKDRAGRKSYYDYDALKRLVRVQDANGNTLQMDYDAEGNMVRLLDAKGHSTQWTYDASGRVTQKTYHDGKSESTSYSGGLVSASKDARGRVVSYSYDANSNLTGINYPTMADVSLSYNALDDVEQVVDGVGTHGFSYSGTGRLLGLNGPWADDAQKFGYDGAGRLTSQSVGRGASGGVQSQSYSFDALERLRTLTSGAGTFTYNYAGATEMLARLDLPNGTRTEQEYDSLHRLTRVKNLTGGGGTLASYAYGYDDRDVKTGVRANLGDNLPQEVGYFYDAVDQLVGERSTSMGGGGAAYSDYTNTFQYDSMGNRTRAENITIRGSTLTRSTANDLNQIVASSTSVNGDEVQNSGFAYDASGNLTQTTSSDGSKTLYTYDEADRLVRIESRNVADAPTRKSEFTYDYASRKVISREFTYTNGAWVKSSEVRRVFGGLDVIQERNDANQATAHYTRDGNIGGILARTSHSGHSYFHYDGGGNVTALSDEQGVLVGRYAYDAFGNTLEASGERAAENPYRFSTKEYHAYSGLIDYGYRFYSSGDGRWLNRDPIEEEGGVNLYAFVNNDSVNSIDEYGLMDVDSAGPNPRRFSSRTPSPTPSRQNGLSQADRDRMAHRAAEMAMGSVGGGGSAKAAARFARRALAKALAKASGKSRNISPFKKIIQLPSAKKAYSGLPPNLKESYHKGIGILKRGEAGYNQHALGGPLAGKWAMDLPNGGNNRGGMRIVYEKCGKEIKIHNITDYH